MEFWLRGFILGFSIAAPVGPIGLLCIQRTLGQGRQAGFISGLGAASADAVYGSLAAFGLSAVLVSVEESFISCLRHSILSFWKGISTEEREGDMVSQ